MRQPNNILAANGGPPSELQPFRASRAIEVVVDPCLRGCSGSRSRDPAPVADAITGRDFTDAWQRITNWLQHNSQTPTLRCARVGVSPTAITALEHDLGIRISTDLRALWFLNAGEGRGRGTGCLPGNKALMPAWW
ncbi:hypothetical protein [Streptomyces sp. NBC_01363]|uniref:hypothetical protein n=1 Tax=Streptomyces sp. NBC_01363 TaxID=2903840 RepID=UPI002255772B|nr:hypothetical protein [Streptomyces sp. NBC_01363]MCX4734357.1 hypothetical protein [Streptomyces sp. NBC_01363]